MLPAVPTRAQIDALAQHMRSMEQVELPVTHTYGPGFYCRTIDVPAGVTLVGKEHATEHVFALTKGRMVLVSDGQRMEVEAPFQVVCQPGVKRAGHAITDCRCTNLHVTELTDLAELEAALIVPEALPAPEPLEALA